MPQPMSQVKASASDSRTAQVQQQVNDVVGIMSQNIEKVMERGEKLNTIQNKTEDLQQGAITFKKTSKEVKDKLWWQGAKLWLIIGGIVSTVILIGVVAIMA